MPASPGTSSREQLRGNDRPGGARKGSVDTIVARTTPTLSLSLSLPVPTRHVVQHLKETAPPSKHRPNASGARLEQAQETDTQTEKRGH